MRFTGKSKMLDQLVPFGGPEYLLFLSIMLFGRSMDFFSTWVATPNLVLEANPIAKKMGWRVGVVVNAAICGVCAVWPLPSVAITTTSLLVAARNFQSAWLMRAMGELEYRIWMSERIVGAPRFLFYFCLLAQTSLVGLLGTALMYFSGLLLVPFGVGVGMVTYAAAVLVYSLLSVWRSSSR
jgi:hypothetical protein